MMYQTKHFTDFGMGETSCVFLYPEKFAALSKKESALSGMIATFVIFYLFTSLHIFSPSWGKII